MAVRSRVRWAVRHGLIRRAVTKRLREGDLGARLMMDPAVRDDPFDFYDRIRDASPLVSTGLAMASASHDTCTAVLRSPDFGVGFGMDRLPRLLRWAYRASGGESAPGPVQPPSMLAVDPPDHSRYRRLVTRAFSARAIAALRDRTQEIADELLDGIDGEPSVDLVSRYAALLPITVIAEVLGAPVAMREQFLRWGEGAALSLDAGLSYRDFRRSERNLRALQSWMLGHFAEVRRSPRQDVISSLVGAHDDGQLTEDELSSIAMLLLAAGFETTVNLLGNGTVALLRHPEQLEVLRSDPSCWPNAVEEILRYDSPVQRTGRIVAQDTEVGGIRLAEGSFVVALLGGANRDPAVFPQPRTFDVRRPNAGANLAFSSGVHYCVGAGLAKMEGEVGLRVLFERFPGLTLDGQPHRRPTRVLRGYDVLAVRPISSGIRRTGGTWVSR